MLFYLILVRRATKGMMSMMDHYRSSLVAPMLSSYTGTPPGNVAVSPSGLHCVDGTGSFLDLIRSSSSSSSCYVPSRSSYYDVVAPVPEPPKYLTTVAPSYSPVSFLNLTIYESNYFSVSFVPC